MINWCSSARENGVLDLDPELAVILDEKNVQECQDKSICTVDCNEFSDKQCKKRNMYNLETVLKPEDPIAVASYYYSCVLRSYQNCGRPMVPFYSFANNALPDTKSASSFFNSLRAKVNETQKSLEKNIFNVIADLFKGFSSQKSKFENIATSITDKASKANWLQVNLLQQYKNLNDLLKSKGLQSENLEVNNIERNFEGCSSERSSSSSSSSSSSKSGTKKTNFGQIVSAAVTGVIKYAGEEVKELVTQLGSCDQKVLFNTTMFDVTKSPVLPPFDKVQQAFNKFTLSKLFWEVYTLMSTYKTVCTNKPNWK